jgi:hypothetical protein
MWLENVSPTFQFLGPGRLAKSDADDFKFLIQLRTKIVRFRNIAKRHSIQDSTVICREILQVSKAMDC